MASVLVADSFLAALEDLDVADAKRAVAFLEKLLRAPDAAGLRPEIVHDAADRAIRSFKVTHDLRTIAHVGGDVLILLFVARHDRAYAWARDRCVECHPVTGERRLVLRGGDPEGAALHVQLCETSGDLCAMLDARGISHSASGE